MLNVSMNGIEIPIIFIVVKGIEVMGLLGSDFLDKHNAIINFEKGILSLDKEGQIINVKFNGKRHDRGSKVRMVGMGLCINDDKDNGEKKSQSKHWADIIDIDNNEREDRRELIKILQKYESVFSDRPGLAKGIQCKLNIDINATTFSQKPYPVPYSKLAAVQAELDRMMEEGIIEKSSSPYSNPLVVVVKKDGGVRICLDARKLNRIIIPDREQTECIDEILKKFEGKNYFSTLDLTAGYWQIQLAPESRKYTAFLFRGRNYQFCRLPFGLNTSVSVFVKCIDKILGSEILSFTTVYVDDILIASETFKEHCEQISKVLKALNDNNITVKLSKSKFLRKNIKFLGYVISPQGIIADPDKIKCIQEFPVPINIKQMQAFLGLCNFYRKFQKNYSELTAKFANLLCSKNKWVWGKQEQENFELIKQRFLQTVILCHPDFSKTLYLNTDASNISVGAELYQLDEEGEHRVLAFASRKLLESEKNYCVTEKELLSIVFACTKFRTFLLGNKVIVRSDHRALSFLKNCKLTHGRLVRWTLLLQEYDLEIEYCKGCDNIVGDVLSRIDSEGGEAVDVARVFLVNLSKLCKTMPTLQQNDVRLADICNRLPHNTKLQDYFLIYQKCLFQRSNKESEEWKLCIPKSVISDVIWDCHNENGHIGSYKCYSLLKESCIFPGMLKIIKYVVKACDLCQRAKVNNQQQEGLMKNIIPEAPLSLVAVDLYGPLPVGKGGVAYLFVVLDTFSKYVKLYPIKKATARAVSKRMVEDYVQEVGKPQVVLSDHGTQFTSQLWRQRLEQSGMIAKFTSVYHPQSNMAERVMRELGRMFRTYCHAKHTTWPSYVSRIEGWINHSTHESTGFTPLDLMKGRRPPRSFQKHCRYPPRTEMSRQEKLVLAEERLLSKAQQRKIRHDRAVRNPVRYQPGQLVLLKTHPQSSALDKEIKKFFLLYSGPYEVVDSKLENAYILADPKTKVIKGTYNVNQLKIYHYSDPPQ